MVFGKLPLATLLQRMLNGYIGDCDVYCRTLFTTVLHVFKHSEVPEHCFLKTSCPPHTMTVQPHEELFPVALKFNSLERIYLIK